MKRKSKNVNEIILAPLTFRFKIVVQKEESGHVKFLEQNWTPTVNPRLWEKHFLQHDFGGNEVQYKTRGRKGKRGELIRPGVTPSVCLNFPHYLTKDVTPHSAKATSSSGELFVSMREAQGREADVYFTKRIICVIFVTGYTVQTDSYITFCYLDDHEIK